MIIVSIKKNSNKVIIVVEVVRWFWSDYSGVGG